MRELAAIALLLAPIAFAAPVWAASIIAFAVVLGLWHLRHRREHH
jgi:hypothetical protein